jgi:hypothetical protein
MRYCKNHIKIELFLISPQLFNDNYGKSFKEWLNEIENSILSISESA